MKKVAIIIFLCSYFSANSQQINPAEDEIYRESEIAIIKITMDEADKELLLHDDNVWSEDYLRAEFKFVNSLMDTTLTEDVGIRLRGNTSRTQPKRSFKIKFKEFDGEKFFGYKKFNLKAENNDPSMVRELLAMQSFRNANVPATRIHHAEFYINDEYMGIYANVEQLDDEFLAARFNNDTGNLYKCTWPATLEDNGQIYDNGYYELKTNKDINDRSTLAHFVDVLNNTSDENFQIEIEKVFNVQPYLRYLAIEALAGHWDGYSYNKNNFYLYENPDNGLIEFMPYDTDNTFGIDWVDRDWGTRDVLDWPRHGDARPLTKRILDVGSYYWMYVRELDKLIESFFNEETFFVQFDDFKSRLLDPVSRDVYMPLTFGFTLQDFKDSYELNDIAGHLPYGLKPYITIRTSTAKESLEILGVEEKILATYEVYPNPSNGEYLNLLTTDQIDINATSLLNLQGRRIDFRLLKKGNAEYQVVFDTALPSGMYIIKNNDTIRKFFVY